MDRTLKTETRQLLAVCDLTYQKISDKSGVPYGALYHFATKGDDMSSENMQKLYEFLSGRVLLEGEDGSE